MKNVLVYIFTIFLLLLSNAGLTNNLVNQQKIVFEKELEKKGQKFYLKSSGKLFTGIAIDLRGKLDQRNSPLLGRN
ncbi:MAG: hypothetical protein H6999_05045 [Hahellaceae bacterium]|nr:hypothetical protein [Hahellaceae bacterium]